MCRKLRRFRLTVILYTCGSLCALFLFISFNDDVKKLIQQTEYHGTGAHETLPDTEALESHNRNDVSPSAHVNEAGPRTEDGTKDGNGDDKFMLSLNTLVDKLSKLERPWYMQGGGKYPELGDNNGPPPRLWPEEQPNSDRIIDQLMYTLGDERPDGGSGTRARGLNQNLASVQGNLTGNGWEDAYGAMAALGRDGQSGGWIGESGVGASQKSMSAGGKVVASALNNSLRNTSKQKEKGRLKTILLYYGLGMSWGPHVTSGRNVFLQEKCPINTCRLTGNRAHIKKADVVVFKDVFMNPKIQRQPHQLWIMYMLECPLNTQIFVDKNVFNMTATYRHDSDIVTPYEKWVYFDENIKKIDQGVNFAEGKTKKVAWFVSNCVAKNNRLEYARELRKYINVDIFGACGSRSCSRNNAKQCFELLAKNYKFYLAFENSNCRDYISEKFFVNGLGNNVLPIVMGAHPDDYKRVAPEKSYIHVDDFENPAELAEYLHKLDQNDDLYNEYFAWKGTGEFINTHFFCRMCAMAHFADQSRGLNRHYENFNKWWHGPNVCTRRSWRNQPDIFAPDYRRGGSSVTANLIGD